MKTARLINIFIVVFVDLLGFSLILPLLPYYAESFQATPAIVGLLTASYAAASLVGAPLMGRLSDHFGRRIILLLSLAGTLLGFLVLGFAEPIGRALAGLFSSASLSPYVLGVLFFSRILDGLTGGNITVAQAYISDITDEKNRATGLGLIGAAFGLGFIIGPAVGGLLSGWSYSLPAFAAAGLSFLNLLGIFFFLPESLTAERRQLMGERTRPPFTLHALLTALSRPVVGPLLHVRFFFGLAFAMFQSIFSLYAQYRLGLTSQSTGYVLAYVGVVTVLVQGIGIRLVTRRFRENAIIITSLWLMVLGLVGWALTPNLAVLLIVILPLALGGGTLNTVLNSAISKSVSREEIGGTLGLSASLESLTRVIAPTVGGYLLGSLGTWAPGAVSALLVAWATWFAYRRILLVKKGSPAETVEAPPMPERKRLAPWVRLLGLLAGLLAMLVTAFIIWGSTPARPMPEALAALQSDANVSVTGGQWLVFRPEGSGPETGFIIYPGGRVDYRAYAPSARALAEQGSLVVLVRMPLNLAVFDPGAALDVIAAYPEIEHWAVGGHSLGGAMAANFIYTHPGAVDGLVLWASYPAASNDLSTSDVKVLSISGSLDGLSTPEKIAASIPLLPVGTTWVPIEGGNHAGFGWYGPQAGDNQAAISRAFQQDAIVRATVEFLQSLR